MLLVWEVEWAPEPVWTGAEILAHTGIRSPDRPAVTTELSRPIFENLINKTFFYILYFNERFIGQFVRTISVNDWLNKCGDLFNF